ncbi:MAG: UTP--glucose-1-phosphate uridylyltransferase [Candidatus Gracilibacteria bacterium]|nr:UTP--glucose-1-phosphate uridylyltransferase [Candidatus Gracilibacteria bacterium]
MKKITKCVIPAAGMGTRFLPATKALPKEMFPVIDKPVMQMLVEEAVGAGCTDIIIVTGRSKRAIEDHFDSNFELEERLDKSGKFDYLKTVKGLNTLANVVYVRQPYPRGDGDAILRTKTLIGDEPFLVLFGDDIIDYPKSAAQQLVSAYEQKGTPIICSMQVSDEKVSNYGILETSENEEIFKVEKFLEKPKATETKSRNANIGKYILTPDIFGYLEKSVPIGNDGETRLIDAFELLRREKEINGLKIKGTRFDTGSKLGFLKLCINEGLKREEIKSDLTDYIKSLNII